MPHLQVLIPFAIYTAASLLALILYTIDKRRAVRGGWRIRESTLHWIEFLGGWPGGLLAQRLVKHKRAKARYMLVFWTIVALHVAGWGLVIWLKYKP